MFLNVFLMYFLIHLVLNHALPQIPAWQTTYHNSGNPKEHYGTVCQLLPKMFSGSHF